MYTCIYIYIYTHVYTYLYYVIKLNPPCQDHQAGARRADAARHPGEQLLPEPRENEKGNI